MKKTIIAVALASVSVASLNTANAADDSFYAGLSYDHLTLKHEKSYDSGSLTFKLGKNFNKYIGVEAIYGLGVRDETKTTNLGGIPLKTTDKINNYYGAYLTASLPMGESFLFATQLGYASVEGEFLTSYNGVSTKSTKTVSSFSWGVGVDYKLTQAVSVTAGYKSLHADKGSNIEGLTFGAKYAF